MITHLGRVVYDRPKHEFTERDSIRIFTSLAEEKNVAEVAAQLYRLEAAVIKSHGYDVANITIFYLEILEALALDQGFGYKWFLHLIDLIGAVTPI